MHSLISKIEYNERPAIIRAAFFAIAWVICCIMLSWYPGIVFATAFLAAGCIKIKTTRKRWRYLINVLWGISLMTVALFLCVKMLNDGNLHQMSIYKGFLNYVCIFIICGTLFFATGKWKASIVLGTFLLVLLSNINGFIYQFRGKELCPMDFYSAGTALNVAKQYIPKVTSNMVFGWLAWLLVALGQVSAPRLPGFLKLKARFMVLGASVLCLAGLSFASADVPIKMWGTQGTEKNGYYLNFFLGIRDSFIKKPDNYDPENINAVQTAYTPAVSNQNTEDLPNIIVIMNESFADFDILGEVRTNQPITPFLDSLTENTIKGYALSSVFGANTANSEFEFLTGHSMAFLPENSVPYQQYIRNTIYTLVWYMKSCGYTTYATHPYYADGWSRNKIYPKLGFSESTFISSYPRQNILRNYVSDQEMYEHIIDKFNSKTANEPMFLFGITMQNHGGYEYAEEDFVQSIYLDGYSQPYPLAEQYFSVINESDKAMQYLLTMLQDYPEDTIVVFFGDHFPKVETEFYEELHGGSYNTLPEQMLQYQVPFYIWANYDIQEEYVPCTSLNYLAVRMFNAAGMTLPPYYSFLADVEKQIPAMNAMGYYSLINEEFISYDDAPAVEKEMLNKYAIMQYNNMFDFDNRNYIFFQQYIQ